MLSEVAALHASARAESQDGLRPPGELAHAFVRAFTNARKDPDALAEAQRALGAMRAQEDERAWWSAADALADLVVCMPSINYVRNKTTRPLAMEVFTNALVFDAADGAQAAHAMACPNAQSWRVHRTVAVALETALRDGNTEMFERFSRQLGSNGDARDQLERCALALDRSERVELAAALRAKKR